MGEFLSYAILSGIALLSMFLAYKLLLARDNQPAYNRLLLMLIYLVSFSIFPIVSLVRHIMHPVASDMAIVGNMEIKGTVMMQISKPLWGTVLIWLYIAGMAVVTLRTFVILFKIVTLLRSGEKIRCGNNTLVLIDNDRFAPFSWMRYIVMSRSDYADNRSVIISHELKHIACRHYIDLLVARMVCIVNCFNPAAWLMGDELMLVHEYQADMSVISSGHDVQAYQMLLIKKAVGSRFPSLANSLNHSKLKKRITMMYKEKSGAGRKFKALALVPMLSLALCVTAVPGVKAAVSAINSSGVSVSKINEKTADKEISAQNFMVSNLNNYGNQTTVVIKGENLGNNLTVSGGTFTTSGKTYQAKSLHCDMTDGSATITVVFPFLTEFDNVRMSLNVNGKDLVLDLDEFINKPIRLTSDLSEDTQTPSSETMGVQGNSSESSLTGNMEIYIDGEKVNSPEQENLSPDRISSMTVDRKNNAIRISLKK